LLKRLLLLHCRIGIGTGVIGGIGRNAGRGVRRREVLGEDARAVVSGHEEDRIDGEEGEVAGHCGSYSWMVFPWELGWLIADCDGCGRGASPYLLWLL